MKDRGKGCMKTREHKVLFIGGLYKQRVVELKNRYKRNNKHRGREND